jgi:hypothetical protein
MSNPMTTALSSKESRMAPRMRRAPRHRLHPKGDSVEYRLSGVDGRAPATWHFDIYNAERGCFARARMVLDDLVKANERDRALMLLGQLTAVFLPAALKTSEAVHRQDIADAAEDLRQADVVRTPDWISTASPEELAEWERTLREQADASTTLADLIRRERETRKAVDR